MSFYRPPTPARSTVGRSFYRPPTPVAAKPRLRPQPPAAARYQASIIAGAQAQAAALSSSNPNYGTVVQPYVPPASPSYTIPAGDPNVIEYNIGMPKDAYYALYQGTKNTFQTTMNMKSSNEPTTVNNPNQLWTKAGGHKGMLLIHVEPGQETVFDGTFPAAGPQAAKRYGFQFHYNPEAISMAYGGVPNVDSNLETLGMEKFNLTGANTTQSTIAIKVVLNRKFDFKYYDDTGKLKASAPKNLYAPRQPSPTEQSEIYKKGTMYDVEFLLGALLGFKLKSQLRGPITSDIGYISARRTQLHLGQGLRYLGFVNNFSLYHSHFDERMVPIFTTLDLTFSRLPDYPNG